MTLTFELNLDNVKMNQLVGFLVQRPLSLKVIVRTPPHTGPICLSGTELCIGNASNIQTRQWLSRKT